MTTNDTEKRPENAPAVVEPTSGAQQSGEAGAIPPASVAVPHLASGLPDVAHHEDLPVRFHEDDDEEHHGPVIFHTDELEPCPVHGATTESKSAAPGRTLGTGRERKSSPSAEALTLLAKPKIFPSPDFKMQERIVQRLEEAIAGEPAERTVLMKGGAQTVIYIGSVVLNHIPASDGAFRKWMKTAQLEGTGHSLGKDDDWHDLPARAQVDRDVVTNTLTTMLAAGHIDYLRKAGFVGDGWKIIVEVHYYRDRSGAPPNLHKDTLGQTLFVLLNYTNKTPMPGPEWIENPPAVDSHDRQIAHTLPEQFQDDLLDTRKALPAPATIETAELPRHGIVSFVDEAIHHATPQYGHRDLKPGALRSFLEKDPDFKDEFAVRTKKTAEAPPDGTPSRLDPAAARLWDNLERLLALNPFTAKITRPQLLEAGMTGAQAERAVQNFRGGGFNSVNIEDIEDRSKPGENRYPVTGPGGRPLERRMSQLDDQGRLPRQLPADAPRRFFRTWVRVVRDDSLQGGTSGRRKPKMATESTGSGESTKCTCVVS